MIRVIRSPLDCGYRAVQRRTGCARDDDLVTSGATDVDP